MLKYFQSAYLSQYLVIFILAIFLWLPSFFIVDGDQSISLTIDRLFEWFNPDNQILFTAIAFLIILLTALLANQVSTESGISGKISTLGAFVFVLIGSSLSFYTTMSPVIWANLCLVIVVRLLFFIPAASNQPMLLFNAGFILGVASLFAPVTIFFILLIWLSLLTHRSNQWRNYFTSAVGILLPWLFVSVWYFWNDNFSEIVAIWTDLFNLSQFNDIKFTFDIDLILFGFILIISIIASLRSVVRLREKSINLRHNLMIVNYFLVISIVTLIISADKYYSLILITPAVLILTNYLGDVKYRKIFDIITILFILLVFVNQYSRLLLLFN